MSGLSHCENGLTRTAGFQVGCLESDELELGGRTMYRGLNEEQWKVGDVMIWGDDDVTIGPGKHEFCGKICAG